MAAEGLMVKIAREEGQTDAPIAKSALSYPFLFQCPPLESFKVTHAYQHTDYIAVGLGQISRKNAPMLKVVTFETLFVDDGSFILNPLSGSGPARIADATNRLVEICESGTAFRLQAFHPSGLQAASSITGASAVELDMVATLRTMSIEERAGEGDARYTSVEFHEYVNPAVAGRRLGTKRHPRGLSSGGGGRVITDPKHPIVPYLGRAPGRFPKSYTLAAGDTLASISKYAYGDPTQWRLITTLAANGIPNVGPNADLTRSGHLHAGSKITLPAP